MNREYKFSLLRAPLQLFAIKLMNISKGPLSSFKIQWNPSCEATTFAPEMWPFKRVGLSSSVEIYTFMFRFTLPRGLSRGVGLTSRWPLKRGSTVYISVYHDEIK